MSCDEHDAWEKRYTEGLYCGHPDPSPYLATATAGMAPGRALDLACGTGRHAFALAAAGWQVDAVDVSPTAIARARAAAADRGLDVRFTAADLDEFLPGPAGYDLVTVFRFRSPRIWPLLPAVLVPGGRVVVEHHLLAPGTTHGPSDEGFRLRPQELLRGLAELRVLHYEEYFGPNEEGERVALARITACLGDPGW